MALEELAQGFVGVVTRIGEHSEARAHQILARSTTQHTSQLLESFGAGIWTAAWGA